MLVKFLGNCTQNSNILKNTLSEIDDIDFNIWYKKGYSLLHAASACGILIIVQALLSYKKIDINLKDSRGNTPLHYAVSYGNIDIITLLLQQDNIDINAQNKLGDTVLNIAIKSSPPKKKFKIFKMLFERSDIDLNIKNHDDQTFYDIANTSKNDSIEKYLLNHITLKNEVKIEKFNPFSRGFAKKYIKTEKKNTSLCQNL